MTAPEYTRTFLGSVNRWECDENDHLNVRFYVRMAEQANARVLAGLGIATDCALNTQHMRFIAEARLATPISGYSTIIEARSQSLTVLTELRHSLNDSILASIVSTYDVTAAYGNTRLAELSAPLPAHAGSRGLPAQQCEYAQLSLDAALQHGFRPIGMGIIQTVECDTSGNLLAYGYMGRTSDSMPNLWSLMQTEEELNARSDGFVGGAVVEYRMHYHRPLAQGEAYTIVSGLRALGTKTQHFVHLMYHSDSGECAMSAEAVGIVLNLKTRTSMPIPDDRRVRMQALLLPPLE